MSTLGERQTETRIARMALALKDAMTTDPNGRVIIAGFVSVLDENPELWALFEELCGNFMVGVTMHEHHRWLGRDKHYEGSR